MSEREISGQGDEGSGGAYRAFLLRCWQEPGAGSEGRTAWRFTLVQVGEDDGKRCFYSLEDIFSFLKTELERD